MSTQLKKENFNSKIGKYLPFWEVELFFFNGGKMTLDWSLMYCVIYCYKQLCLSTDNRQGACWLTMRGGMCEKNMKNLITKSECCGSVGVAWGSPCQECPPPCMFSGHSINYCRGVWHGQSMSGMSPTVYVLRAFHKLL